LETLQLALGSGIGALQAALGLPETVEQGELVLGIVGIFEEIYLTYFHANQFPLRDCHLLDVELFGPGLGMPFDFEVVAELSEFLAVFARQHDGAGAKSVTEGVHADSSLSLGSFGAGRLLGVASIRFELLESCHIVILILTNKAKLRTGRNACTTTVGFLPLFPTFYNNDSVEGSRIREISGAILP
jgi:hypothetical protein